MERNHRIGIRRKGTKWIVPILLLSALAWFPGARGQGGEPLAGAPVEIRSACSDSTRPVLVAVEGKGWLERRAGNLVLHVAGTPYEMGYQHGVLLRPQIQQMLARLYAIGAAQALLDPKKPALLKIREAYERCLPHIPKDILEELRGVAAGSSVSLEQITTANMIPELFHCSGFALWGRATKDKALYHGRILDYAMEIGYHEYAVLIVARPQGKHAFINVGYTGFIGSVTGTNEKQVSFGEMGGRGEGLWDGMPMAFLMRKGLEEADTLDEGVAIFRDTPRTCEYYYVISDAKIPDARGLATRPDKFLVLKPGEPHPDLPVPTGILDTVLMSGDERFQLLAARTIMGYGKFDGPAALALMRRPVAMRSCIHAALFAPAKDRLWVSNAVGTTPASELPYTEYSLRELFEAKVPGK
ncbi:MAG: C45 family autoproteolytic acyltransferase/hydrolase [Candidatus Sumerlaeia bacterium]|nr:C45 family autoproteolytic acyltransferase/hydrolase [Candidatus Sumerlaeia bacterium]